MDQRELLTLEHYLKQYGQQAEIFASQLELMENGRMEALAAVEALQGISDADDGTVLLQIGGGASVRVKVLEPDKVLLNIGADVIVATGVRLDFSGGLLIGDGTVISEDAVVYTHEHGLDPKSNPKPAPLHIGEGVWVGSRVVVIEGVGCIGAGAVVASGSVVTREVPPGVVVAGVPARVIKSIAHAG